MGGARVELQKIVGISARTDVQEVNSEEDEGDADTVMKHKKDRKRADTPETDEADAQAQKRPKRTDRDAGATLNAKDKHGSASREGSPERKTIAKAAKDSPARKPMGPGPRSSTSGTGEADAAVTPGALPQRCRRPLKSPRWQPVTRRPRPGSPARRGLRRRGRTGSTWSSGLSITTCKKESRPTGSSERAFRKGKTRRLRSHRWMSTAICTR